MTVAHRSDADLIYEHPWRCGIFVEPSKKHCSYETRSTTDYGTSTSYRPRTPGTPQRNQHLGPRYVRSFVSATDYGPGSDTPHPVHTCALAVTNLSLDSHHPPVHTHTALKTERPTMHITVGLPRKSHQHQVHQLFSKGKGHIRRLSSSINLERIAPFPCKLQSLPHQRGNLWCTQHTLTNSPYNSNSPAREKHIIPSHPHVFLNRVLIVNKLKTNSEN